MEALKNYFINVSANFSKKLMQQRNKKDMKFFFQSLLPYSTEEQHSFYFSSMSDFLSVQSRCAAAVEF
jgi:hypothetical protein